MLDVLQQDDTQAYNLADLGSALFGEDAMTTLALQDGPEFERWIAPVRAAVEQLTLDGQLRAVEFGGLRSSVGVAACCNFVVVLLV